MNILIQQIENLMFDYDCVIIPGFGGFVGNFKPACEHEGVMYPSIKQLAFNSNLTHNDGLLINYIARQEAISFAEAQEKVRLFVTSIDQAHHRGQQVEWGEIGTTYLSNEGTIHFERRNNLSFSYKSYGLKPVPMLIPIVLNEEEENVALTVQRTVEKATKPKHKSSIKYWLVGAAAAAVLFLMPTHQVIDKGVQQAGILYNSLSTSTISNSKPSTKEVSTDAEKTAVISTMPQPTESTTDNATPNALDNNAPTTTAPTTAVETTKKVEAKKVFTYHIIIGSCPSRQDANKQKSYLESKGLKGIQIIPAGDRFRLSAQHFDSKQEADEEMLTLKQAYSSINDAWVLRKRN